MHYALMTVAAWLLLIACSEEKVAEAPYTVQYGLSGNAAVHLRHVHLDSMLFADGRFRYVLDGDAQMGNAQGHFSVMLTGHPFSRKKFHVLSTNFPFESISDTFACDVYRAKEDLVIDWRSGIKQLKLVIAPTAISAD